jgi:hypothetical protein
MRIYKVLMMIKANGLFFLALCLAGCSSGIEPDILLVEGGFELLEIAPTASGGYRSTLLCGAEGTLAKGRIFRLTES